MPYPFLALMSLEKPGLSAKPIVALRRHISSQELLKCSLKASGNSRILEIMSGFFDDTGASLDSPQTVYGLPLNLHMAIRRNNCANQIQDSSLRPLV